MEGGNKIEISSSNTNQYENIIIRSESLPDGDIEETDNIEFGNVRLFDDINYMYILKNKIEEYMSYTRLEEKSALLGVLAEEYKNQKNYVYIKDLNEYPVINYQNIAITNILMVDQSLEVAFYIVDGLLYNNYENDSIEEVKIGVKLDFYNKLYEIFPYEFLENNELLNINIGDNLNVSENYIAINENNSYSYKIVKDEEIAKMIIETLKIKVNFWSKQGLGLEEIKSKNIGINSSDELSKINEYEIQECRREKSGKKTKYICETTYGELILEQKEGIEYIIGD